MLKRPKEEAAEGSSAETPPAKVEHDPALKNETCFHFPDCLFMWAWFASVIIMFWIAMQYGVAEMEEQYQEYLDQQDLTVDEAESQIDDSVSDAVVGCKNVIKIFGIAMAAAVVISFLWTGILVMFGELLITALFFAAIGLLSFIGFTCMFTLDGSTAYYIGLTFFALAGLCLLYYCCIRSRIKFASTTLAIACKIIQHDYMLFVISLLMLVLTGCYTLVFCLAEFGAYFKIEGDDDSTESQRHETIAWFSIMLLYFWTVQVFANIVVVTVSGAAKEWWFAAEGLAPVMSAFCRACTYDLGAICFGSLIVAIIQTVYAIVIYLEEKARKQGNKLLECLLACLACLIACIQKCVEYMNKYAYTYVGIYGYGFMTAGMKVMSLFANEGLTIIQNDLIVEYVLLFGSLVVGMLTCGVGLLAVIKGPAEWTQGLHPYARGIVGTVCFFIGLGISFVMNGIIDAANKAVFILYLENPHALEHTHPEAHDKLTAAWKMIGHTERAEDVAA